MNRVLRRLANEMGLGSPAKDRLRLEFGYACVNRVAHLIENPAVAGCVASLADFLAGKIDCSDLAPIAEKAAALANQHEGSKSIDGCGHAAVSATYAVANAIAGKAIETAEYAAYATVYGQGGYAAVSNRESFQPEFDWQVDCLKELNQRRSINTH
jgi:hypothetical protein